MPTRIARSALIAAVAGLIGGLSGALVAQPAGRLIHPTAVSIGSTAADALDVSGGAEFGSGDVELIGTDGKINGPLSSTILDNLSGVNLTALNASNLGSGTVPTVRLPDGLIVEYVHDVATSAVTDGGSGTAGDGWDSTGLTATINVDDGTNDVLVYVQQTYARAAGSTTCQLRLEVGGTVQWTVTQLPIGGSTIVDYHRWFLDANPGSGNKTYDVEFQKSGSSGNECLVQPNSGLSNLLLLEIQD